LLEIFWYNNMNADVDLTFLLTDKLVDNPQLMNYTLVFPNENFTNVRWDLPDDAEVLYETIINKTAGRHLTNVAYQMEDYRDLSVVSGCYGFYFHLLTDEAEKVTTGCMRTNANWMRDMKQALSPRKFRQIFIPGTHDSASFKYNFHPSKDNIVSKYSLTQDGDITTQLLHGIRYLDLRVGYYRSSEIKFWANHGISRLHPLIDIIRQVKDFIDQTEEIVILDIQEFPIGELSQVAILKASQLRFFF